MTSTIDTALSGLNAAAKKLETSANNIANQFSTQSQVNGQTANKPYVPQQVDQVSLSGGGVQTQTTNVNPPTQTVPDNGSGNTQLPNVSQDQELIQQDIATYNFKANLKVIQVQQQMQQSLLDIQS